MQPEEDKIIIHSIDYSGSIVDGPGIRTVLFLQGCDIKCKGCQNSSIWNINDGIEIEIKKLAQELIQKIENKKITISGGEPLMQYDALIKLVKQLKNFDIALYTGHSKDKVPNEILKYLKYLKIGNFIQETITTTEPFIGSTNQEFITL